MEEDKQYFCECGKQFTSSQSFNGHKSSCKIHQIHKHGSLDFYKESRKRATLSQQQTAKELQKIKEQQLLEIWIAEQHQCECCGKVMTEKYGSGRFCCRACANTRKHSEETKNKIAKTISSLSGQIQTKRKKVKRHFNKKSQYEYEKSPAYCTICGKKLPYEKRKYKTCGRNTPCYKMQLSKSVQKAVAQKGGNLNPRGSGTYKRGTYHGIKCDSSWELAFLVYHLDSGINILRNTDSFQYIFEGKQKQYYPDFIINNVYYEIKGYKRKNTVAKIQYFPKELCLIVIDKTTIKPYLEYVKSTYGEHFWEVLYDITS